MNNKMFFMPRIQMAAKDIHMVRISLAFTLTGSDVVHLPSVVVNGIYSFEGGQGVVAIEELRAVGFYNDEQYKVVAGSLSDLFGPLRANHQCD